MSQNIMLILEKIVSKDKDFRYMATSDLLNELQKENFKIVDEQLERKLCMACLNQLEDLSGDISGLAVKCVGLLVKKVGDNRADEMIKALCEKVTAGKKEQQRDIACIGMKTIIAELSPGPFATTASLLITSRMLEGSSSKLQDNNIDVTCDCLDIVTDLFARFGSLVASEHTKIVNSLLPYLDDSRTQLRKRALHCLAALAVTLNDEVLARVVNTVLQRLTAGGLKQEMARSYMTAVGVISRAVGYRFGRYLNEAVPLANSYCDSAKDGDDEMREFCLQALEVFVVRCPQDARGHLDAILGAGMKYMRYDPNFADDMEEDGDEGGDEDDEGLGGSDEDYSDDEDMSWKVRRAAVKTIAAVIMAYPDALAAIYTKTAAELMKRFREREESVRTDVFAAFTSLVSQVGETRQGGHADPTSDPSSPAALLSRDVPQILHALARSLRDRSASKARCGAFIVLRALTTAVPKALEDHMSEIMPGVLAPLEDKTTTLNLKIEVLTFVRLALEANPPSVFSAHASAMVTAVAACVNDRYYKVAAEALRVCGGLVKVLRPEPPAPISPGLTALVDKVVTCVASRGSAHDEDQEVKEAALSAAGAALARLGDVMGDEHAGRLLRLVRDRMANEIMWLGAVKALTHALTASLEPPRSVVVPILVDVVPNLTSFLRKANRGLRQAAFTSLEALAARYAASLDASAIAGIVGEGSAALVDNDLSLAAGALRLFVTLLKTRPDATDNITDKALTPALQLVRSPMLQGAALVAVTSFFTSLASSGSTVATYESLTASLLKAGAESATRRTAQNSVATVVAALAVEGGRVGPTLVNIMQDLPPKGDAASQRLALLVLGEIGRRTDMSSFPDVEPAISKALLEAENEEVRGAASLALGGLVASAPAMYLPGLLSRIRDASGETRKQYPLLQALCEVVTTRANAGPEANTLTQADQEGILALLLACCEGEEECRTVVSECFGRLALLHPSLVIPALQARCQDPSTNVRTVVVSAVKFMVVERSHPVDAHLQAVILDFLSLMSDPDRHVRRAAVLSLAATAHHKPGIVGPHLPAVLPALYAQTAVREDLIRTVDLGPFKHRIDDGLELRKAAFECLDILLERTRERLDPAPLLAALDAGLRDAPEIRIAVHASLMRCANLYGAALLGSLDRLVEALDKTLSTKLKNDAVKQEVDRHEDLLRSCLRCVDALSRVPGIETCAAFTSFMRRSVNSGAMKEMYERVQKERTEAEGFDAMDVS